MTAAIAFMLITRASWYRASSGARRARAQEPGVALKPATHNHVVIAKLALTSDQLDQRGRTAEVAPQNLAEVTQLGRNQRPLVLLGDGRVRLEQHHADQVQEARAEGPAAVHVLQQLHPARLHGVLQSVREPEPNGHVQLHLRPRKDPGNGPNLPNPPVLRALGRPRTNVHETHLAHRGERGEVVGEAHGVPDHLAVRTVGYLRHFVPEPRPLRLHRDAVGVDVEPDARGQVVLHGSGAVVRHREHVPDRLALHREPEVVVERPPRLRHDRLVQRPAAPRDGAAPPVEVVHGDALALRDGKQHLLRLRNAFLAQSRTHLVELPRGGQPPPVLPRVGVPDHDLLRVPVVPRNVPPVPPLAEQPLHDGARRPQRPYGLQQRHHPDALVR
ncbi:tRNA N6-adenosine threonylcarbamoyltransferase, mitochondrial, putative [Babesia caballi]|uniref:tRNA N6-adenosine threonylcarbamoyltransferase, mitochondrial, putative n=1 Tax=Babesia caballi TaxID=5871 RepID=A0AAV4LYG0_BABCB|nr:tRNA N6-adenosine threonylcarbamoyltransferase, mitochondrial, putative [Babesia caballi]